MGKKQVSLAAVLLALCLTGCSSSSSPTSPGSLQISIAAGMVNTALAPTILDAQLLFDGGLVADSSSTTAVAVVALNATGGTASGTHTLAFLIASQTSSPNTYTVPAVTIQVFDANGNFLKTVTLAAMTASLATGATISYSFTI